MFSGFYPTDTDDDEVCPTSSNADLWEEVQRLRRANSTLEKRLQATLEARTLEGKPILVLNGNVEYEDVQTLFESWRKLNPNGAVWCLPPDVKISELGDADLHQIGLKRVTANGPVTERDLYESMLKGH